jgi:hypothetical protein
VDKYGDQIIHEEEGNHTLNEPGDYPLLDMMIFYGWAAA